MNDHTNIESPSLSDVEAVTEGVWSAFLGASEPFIATHVRPTTNPDWTSAVTVTGAWNGVIRLELDTVAAHKAARGLLGILDEEDLDEADVADAVGELVNMVGGNIKSLLPGPSTLSIPVVTAGRITPLSNQVEICRLDGIWAGHAVGVTVSSG